jgi:hypothetical protein
VRLQRLLLLVMGYEAVTAVGRRPVKNTIASDAPLWANGTLRSAGRPVHTALWSVDATCVCQVAERGPRANWWQT